MSSTELFTKAEWSVIWAEFDEWYQKCRGEDPEWETQKEKLQELIDTVLKDR